MKIIYTSLLLFSFLVFPRLSSNNNFDGLTKSSGKEISSKTIQTNDFTGSFTMEVTVIKKGKVEKDSPMSITYHIKDDQIAFVPELEDAKGTRLIFDMEDKTMTTLMNEKGKKTGMKMKIPEMKFNQQESEKYDYTITPTGETKVIDGYNCKKYLIENEETTGHVWITEDVKMDFEKIFSFVNMQKKDNAMVPKLSDIEGFAIESETRDKKKDEVVKMKMININPGEVDESVFDTSGHNIMDMSNMMNMGGNK